MTSKKVLRGKLIFQKRDQVLLKLFFFLLRRSTRSKDIFAYYWTCYFAREKNNRKNFIPTTLLISSSELIIILSCKNKETKKRNLSRQPEKLDIFKFLITPIIFNIDDRKRERERMTYFARPRLVISAKKKKKKKFFNGN